MSRIDTSLGSVFSGTSVQLYKYEPFSGNVFRLAAGTNLALERLDFTSAPSLNAFLVHVDSSTVAFTSAAGPTNVGSNLNFTIQDISGTQILDSKSYTVNIGAGRFIPPTPSNIEFFKNEPIGTSTLFIGSIPISTPASTVSLPVGLSFSNKDVCSYYLTGTPASTFPASNYNILATGSSNPSQIISIQPIIKVSPERLRLDISGTGYSTNATVGVDISRIVVTGRCPPYTGPGGIYSNTNIRYSWTPSVLPEGLRFTNSAGVTLNNGDRPTSDSSSTIILQGAITNAGIQTLASSNLDIALTGIRVSNPVISNTSNVRVSFKETVVFDVPTITTLYNDSSINSSISSNSIFARTIFPTGVSIKSITSSNLPTGIGLDFSSNAQRAFLVGTPSVTPGSYTSTVEATNTNDVSSTYTVNFNISNDFVSFSAVADACSSFIITRSLSNAKTGYYSSPIRFIATSGSGCNVSMTITSDICGTGLTFTGTDGPTATYTLGGRPTSTKALTTATVTANVAATSTSNTTSFQYSILPEKYTFSDASINAIQNVPITPVSISATALSGNPVIWYSSSNLPSALTMDTTGVISGTVRVGTGGTFDVRVSTGYTLDTCTFSYYVTPDSIVLFAPQSSYTYDAGANVTIPITGLSYSGATVSNYRFSGLPDTGLTIGSSSGIITGPLSDSIPPNPILPLGTTYFDILGSVGLRNGDVSATFTTINPIVNRSFLADNRPLGSSFYDMAMFTNDTSDFVNGWVTSNTFYSNSFSLSNSELVLDMVKMSDFKIKNTTIDSNVFMGTLTDTTGRIIRSTNGVTFSDVLLGESGIVLSSIVNKPGTSTWFAAGTDTSYGSVDQLQLKASSDDGLTWYQVGRIRGGGAVLRSRDIGTAIDATSAEYPYLYSGTSLAYKNGVLVVGGRNPNTGTNVSFLYSTDDGSNWSIPSGDVFEIETSKINVDGSGVWIATGSSIYDTQSLSTYASDTYTITCSSNDGSSWSRAETPVSSLADYLAGSNGQFNYIAYDSVYANGCWLASGISSYYDGFVYSYYSEVRASSNGSNWTRLPFFSISNDRPTYGLIGPILYANNSWNILTIEPSGTTTYTKIATHADTSYGDITSLLTDWSDQYMFNGSFVTNSKIPSYRGFTVPQYVRTGSPTQAIITFQNTSTNGPTFTSPIQTNYTVYQYMPIVPIIFSATGTGNVYLFVDSGSLPTGLVWDPYTQKISGKTVNVGTYSFTVYARDDVGISAITIYVTTVIPRVVRQQTSAGAYTYLLRQYTEVNAAQNSRDNRVMPTQDVPLGKFMAPPAPNVTTTSNCGC